MELLTLTALSQLTVETGGFILSMLGIYMAIFIDFRLYSPYNNS